MEVEPTVYSALNDWKAMRAQLRGAIMSYATACDTLFDVCARSSDKPAVERAQVAIDDELEALEGDENMLCNLRRSAGKLRNGSKHLVRINILPSEVLARIFAFTGTRYCLQRNRPDDVPVELPYSHGAVCYRWRQLILNTPSLWWHIDMGPGVPQGVTELLVERAESSPIYVHARETSLVRPSIRFDHKQTWLADAIAPYADRIYALDLVLGTTSQCDFINSALSLWFSQDNMHLSRFLSLSSGWINELELDSDILSSRHAQDMFQTLSGICMRGFAPIRDISACSALVELELDLRMRNTAAYTVSTDDLALVLAASPAMCVLVLLGGIEICQTANYCSSVPVPLEHLRVLNLQVPPASLELILSLIRLPSFSSDLSICIEIRDKDIGDTLSSFLDNAPVTTLHLFKGYEHRGLNTNTQCPSLPILLPYLRVLVIENLSPFDAPPVVEDAISGGLNAFGARRTRLILLSCRMDHVCISTFVTRTGINDVRIEIDSPAGVEAFSVGWLHIQKALLQIHPELECSLSSCSIYERDYYRPKVFN